VGKHKKIWSALGAVVTTAILVALVWHAGPAGLLEALLGMPWWSVAILTASYVLACFLRGLRFRLLLGGGPGIGAMTALASAQAMLADFMPLRSGELSYFYLLRRADPKRPPASALPSLIASRALDAAGMGVILAAAAAVGWASMPPGIQRLALPALAAGALLGVILVLSLALTHIAARRLLSADVKPAEGKWRALLRHHAEAVMEGLQEVRSPLRLAQSAILSLGIWLTVFLGAYVFWRGAGIPCTLPQQIVINSLTMLAQLLPLVGPAGAGLPDAVWAYLVAQLGVPFPRATALVLSIHLVATIAFLAVGLAGWAALEAMIRQGMVRSSKMEDIEDGRL
jgi:glycosyltransferase 2 family protein